MLEDLMVQRDRHDRHRNLVVAATGTGKTVVAALDYRALCQRAGRPLTLLFVAHRQEILEQSRATFAHVMWDPSFGEFLGGQRAAARWTARVRVRADAAHSVDELARTRTTS